MQGFATVPGLLELVATVGLVANSASDGARAAACELALEALVGEKRIGRTVSGRYVRARHEGPSGQGFKGFDPLERSRR